MNKDEKPQPCIYCKKDCFIKSFGKRYDESEWVATCPRGKALDRACEAIAEAEYNVLSRKTN